MKKLFRIKWRKNDFLVTNRSRVLFNDKAALSLPNYMISWIMF